MSSTTRLMKRRLRMKGMPRLLDGSKMPPETENQTYQSHKIQGHLNYTLNFSGR
jgi:hypothetical protein